MTMANVIVPFPGASARDVETLVATPAEQVIAQIQGLEHVYSVSKPGMAIITAEFKVGVPRTEALVRLYDTINANRDWLPKALNVGEPLIKPKGIDDVRIVTLTLWTADEARGAFDLEQVAHAIEVELKRVPGTREVTTIGGPGRVVRVLLDAQSAVCVRIHRRRHPAGALAPPMRHSLPASSIADNRSILVETGAFLANADGSRLARRRRDRRQSDLPVRCGAHRRWSSAAVALRLARHRSGGGNEGDRPRRANFPP